MTRVASTRMIAPLAVLLAAVVGSCTEISANASTATAIEFDSLPFPAIVTGDTLRDTLGHAAPLAARAFNINGVILPNAAISYLALDSGLTISATGIVTAQARNGSVRIIASVPGLQSTVETLVVARRPDSVVATAALIDTLFYSVPDSAAVNVTAALGLKLATIDTVGGIAGTQGWLVSYQLLYHGKALAITDTTIASLWNTAGVASLLDTTGADGTVAPRLRVRSTLLPTLTESVTVVANVRYRGAPVRGSPVIYLVQLRIKPHS